MRRGDRRGGGIANAVVVQLAAVWALVSPLPAHAYNLQLTQTGARVRWYASDVELKVSPELEQHFAELPLARLLSKAATVWAGLAGAPHLRIVPGAPGAVGFEDKKPSNGVYLVRDWKLFPDALAVTVATFESRTGKIVDTDILVNANFKFALLPDTRANAGSYDLLSVMTHEMGHVLGLGDTTDVPEATMWPSVSPGDTHQRDLEADDEEGVEEVYAGSDAPSRNRGGCGGASVLAARAPAEEARAPDQIGLFILLWLALWLASRAFPRTPIPSRSGGGSGRGNSNPIPIPSRSGGGPGRGNSRIVVFGAALLFGGLLAPAPRARPIPDEFAEFSPHELNPALAPAQRTRFATFIKGSERLVVGRAVATRSERRAGLIVTHFVVRSALRSAELEHPGGSLDGLTQVVSGQPAPAEGDVLLVALRKHGAHGWAHLRDGQLSGGTLGTSLAWR